MALTVLYQDKSLAVAVKPVGALSEDHEKEPCMPALLRETLGDPDAYVGTVHRLDKNVGGLMVYALTPDMTGKLSNALAAEGAGKEYLAVLRGKPDEASGTLTDLLFHDRQKNKTYVVNRKRNGVKEASLSYRVVKTEEETTLVAVKLHTGRTHQIRVQFSSRGLPLVGDSRYGGGKGDPALFAYRLTFRHPVTGKTVTFCQMPEGNTLGGMTLPSLEEFS
ncbi:MAG: RluA family pseudouridine synthase [Clostridia bacterium]|nr:RluA family pseudouridine synthase [Clostridia bacterium]